MVIRYGIAENLQGAVEIAARRAARAAGRLQRTLSRTVITILGRDFAAASTMFRREGASGRLGREMQGWARLPESWCVVAAHVSLIDG